MEPSTISAFTVLSNSPIPQIDVRDLAEAHLKALTEEKAANKRFCLGFPISYQRIVDTLKGLPEVADHLPKDSGETPTPARIEVEPIQEALSLSYRTIEQTFFDAARKILQLEKELGATI